MICTQRCVSKLPLFNKQLNPYVNKKHFWGWINIIFNKVDEDRRATFGPDRVCAEWLLRNGAAVKWTISKEYLTNYNALPVEGTKLLIKEVDASESSIMHYGFPHFKGCQHIDKIILHKCSYLENSALEMLGSLNNTLQHLQISSCNNIDSGGLNKLSNLTNLKKLVLYDLPFVKNKDEVITNLKQSLINCDIEYK